MFGSAFPSSRASFSGPSSGSTVFESYGLSDSGKVLAEYIWLGGSGVDLRSRTIVLDEKPYSIEDLPLAEIDGSACGQASADSCEVYLQPRRIFPDPFRGGDHILVLCDAFIPPQFDTIDPTAGMRPHSSNARVCCEEMMTRSRSHEPHFCFTQEYWATDTATGMPYGASDPGLSCGKTNAWPACLAGGAAGLGRCGKLLQEVHMMACLRAGLGYLSSSMVGPGSWSYKLGPGDALDMADQLWLSRHLLQRLCDDRGAAVSFYPQPPLGDWGGSCCSIEFSTNASRCARSGMAAIESLVTRLQQSHEQHMLAYGRRPAPAAGVAPAPPPPFSAGIGNKRAGVMIPTSTLLNRCGPLLDRRPAPNVCPYSVTALMLSAALCIPLPPGAHLTLPPAAAPAAPMPVPAPGRGCAGWPPALHARLAAFAAATKPPLHSPHASPASPLLATSTCCSGSGPHCPSSLGASPDSEQLLISELERIDAGVEAAARFAPDTPPGLAASLALSGATCGSSGMRSDGSGPALRRGGLAARCGETDMVSE